MPPPIRKWQILYVEDDPNMLRQVREYLEGERFPFGAVEVVEIDDFARALDLLRERKVDVVILDVYRGMVASGDRRGIEILTKWRETGFAPVILHTALPDGLEDVIGPFVRVVPKEGGNLPRLAATITELFAMRIPQIHRSIVDHIDIALRSYMWGFVSEHWPDIAALSERPDFVHLLLRRLSVEVTRNAAPMIRDLYPGFDVADPAAKKVHPVAYYVKPSIGTDPQLGDIRRVSIGGGTTLVLVLWPSCDLVNRGGECKVGHVLCAATKRLESSPEYRKHIGTRPPTKSGSADLLSLMSNNRKSGQAERYHFLPAAWDIPGLIVDFAALKQVPVIDLVDAPCLGTVASPFAESMATRFIRYLARLGTPDLDVAIILQSTTHTESKGA